MKNRYTVLILTLILLLTACQATPTPVATTLTTQLPAQEPTSEPIPEVVATNTATLEPSPLPPTETAVIPAEQGELPVWAASDVALWLSTDGGQNWQDITPPGLQEGLATAGEGLQAVLKADFSGDGFGLAAISQTQQAIIYRTQDGGKTWEESQLTYAEEAQGIVALETMANQLGWLLVTRGLGAGNEWVDLYHTQDGGASWSHLAWSSTEADPFGSIPSGGLKSGISFSSPERGWISGSAPIDAVYLFRTLDGGQTWQPYNLPLPDGVVVSGNSSAPIFFNEQQGVLTAGVYTVEDLPGLAFYWTQDGGENWQPGPVLEGRFTARDWVDAQHGFAAEANDFNQTRLFSTQDGGITWEAYPIQLSVVSKMEFISDQTGWAICGWKDAPGQGCAGELYVTSDGGLSWEIVSP
jgi:photosystem II stability/assembly factor-like uncharacterized protein